MKKFLLASTVLVLLGASVTMSVMAQPPRDERPPGGDRPEGPPPDGPPPEGRRREGEHGEPGRPPMPNPLVAALDTNGDREISAEELQAATASLLTLDKNADGKLTDDEMRPPRPDGGGRDDRPRDGGRDGAGREGGPREGGRDGAPRNGAGREGAPRDGAGRGDGPQGRGQGPGPEGGPMGHPNTERLVEHAMHFDADGDGKLDKSEMMKFAQEFTSHMGRHGGPGGEGGPGGPGGGRPGGPGPEGGGPEGERPRRPAAE